MFLSAEQYNAALQAAAHLRNPDVQEEYILTQAAFTHAHLTESSPPASFPGIDQVQGFNPSPESITLIEICNPGHLPITTPLHTVESALSHSAIIHEDPLETRLQQTRPHQWQQTLSQNQILPYIGKIKDIFQQPGNKPQIWISEQTLFSFLSTSRALFTSGQINSPPESLSLSHYLHDIQTLLGCGINYAVAILFPQPPTAPLLDPQGQISYPHVLYAQTLRTYLESSPLAQSDPAFRLVGLDMTHTDTTNLLQLQSALTTLIAPP